MTQLVGVDGFIALQRRALALARAEHPGLETVQVTPEGRLEGPETIDLDGEAGIAITAHFLELLVTFVGEPLALRLLRDAFPGAAARMNIESEEPS